VPFLLESTARGVTLRTFEERLLQSTDYQELTLLPLRGAAREGTDEDSTNATINQVIDKELRLTRSRDGADGDPARCHNLWEAYRDIRAPPRAYSSPPARADSSSPSNDCSRFGAPLLATILQRLGALSDETDACRVTPTTLPQLALKPPFFFGRPIPIRTVKAR
jgi:hypothetical protein